MTYSPSRRTALKSLAAAAAFATLLSACAGEGSGSANASGAAGGGDQNTVTIDYATYNPLSLIIRKKGWLETALAAEGKKVEWVKSAGSNKANEALRSGNIDVGSTAGSAALLAAAALGTPAAATWTATGVGLVGYVINTTMPMNPDLAGWARISPFHWYGAASPLENGADWGHVAILLAGSAVLLKPASPSRRCAALLAEACWRAGLPRDLVQYVVMGDRALGEKLVRDERVELVVLTGSAETAEMFRSWRPNLPLLAETSGKNALIITPSADLDLAAADLVASAFGHAGQKCSAASLGILVGSVAKSRRLLDQIVDAASSLTVAWPEDPAAQMGPLTEVPGEKLRRGLTELEYGQTWLLKPQRIDDRLWRPGIRTGVRPGSAFHQVEYFGPVLGLMAARDLTQAVEWQNGTEYGLTAGLHSLDAEEIQFWLDHVKAGNLYVNRGITGAIVRRQPFGGWKRSAVGTGGKAGGPNYVVGFGSWEPKDLGPAGALTDPKLVHLLRAAARVLDEQQLEQLNVAATSDQVAWRTLFGVSHDPSALKAEINAFRYRPTPVTVRVEVDDPVRVLREASAALITGSAATFSFREAPSEELSEVLTGLGLAVEVKDDARFDRGVRGRVRHLGERDLLTAVGGSIDVSVYSGPTLYPGRLALLPYVHEQAVSVTNHRFGHPTPLTDDLRI